LSNLVTQNKSNTVTVSSHGVVETVMLVLGFDLKAKICGLGLATASPFPWP